MFNIVLTVIVLAAGFVLLREHLRAQDERDWERQRLDAEWRLVRGLREELEQERQEIAQYEDALQGLNRIDYMS